MPASPTKTQSSARALLPALLFGLAIAGVVIGNTMASPETGEMAVVFPPFTTELTAWALVAEAGGLVVAPTTLSNIVVAYAPDPAFKDRLHQLGALFFVAARGLCAGLPPIQQAIS